MAPAILRFTLLIKCFLFVHYIGIACIKVVDLDCDFDIDLCNWSQDGTDQFDWTQNSGKTNSNNTGPDADHTSGRGYYIYIEATGRNDGDKAVIISRTQTEGKYCLSFWYSMYGTDIKTLTVYTRDNINVTTRIFETNTRANTADWIQAYVNIGSNYAFQILIVGERGSDYRGDIAVDDIRMTAGWCSADCDFDTGFCSWTQEQHTDDYDWYLNKATRHAYFVEIPSMKNGATAVIRSSIIDSGFHCLTIWYTMNGEDTLRLKLQSIENKSLEDTIVIKKNNGGMLSWTLANVPLEASNLSQIFIEGEFGDEYHQGVIAIDNVKICEGNCRNVSDSIDCSFESGICRWKQDTRDIFNWTLCTGSTPSSYTGPSFDHTLQTTSGHYLYIETSNQNNNAKARIISPSQSPGEYCLTFWYHMYGMNIGELTVLMKLQTTTEQLFTKRLNQGDEWRSAKINISSRVRFELMIDGTRGNGWYGDIAIDDINMCPGLCKIESSTIDIFQPSGDTDEKYQVNNLVDAGVLLNDTTAIIFEVKCRSNALVLLHAEQRNYTFRAVEVRIGSLNNVQSSIWDKETGNRLANYSEPNILSASSYRPFWIGWPNNKLRVGKGFIPYEDEFMRWDVLHFDIKFIAIRNGNASDGYWKFHSDKFPRTTTTTITTTTASTTTSTKTPSTLTTLTTKTTQRPTTDSTSPKGSSSTDPASFKERITEQYKDPESSLVVIAAVPTVVGLACIIGVVLFVWWWRKRPHVISCLHLKPRKNPELQAVDNMAYIDHPTETLDIHLHKAAKSEKSVYNIPDEITDNVVYHNINIKEEEKMHNYGHLPPPHSKFVDSNYSHMDVSNTKIPMHTMDTTYSHITSGSDSNVAMKQDDLTATYNTTSFCSYEKRIDTKENLENLQDPDYDHAVAGGKQENSSPPDQYSRLNTVDNMNITTEKHTKNEYANIEKTCGNGTENNYFILEKVEAENPTIPDPQEQNHEYFVLEKRE